MDLKTSSSLDSLCNFPHLGGKQTELNYDKLKVKTDTRKFKY